MILSSSRKKVDTAPALPRAESEPPGGPRSPAVQAKLEGALADLASLETAVAELALAAAEDRADAAKTLAEHRAKIEIAKTQVAELEAAYKLAARLDRQHAAAGAARMRSEQLAAFTHHIEARGNAMAKVMEAAAAMALAYGEYSEATLAASTATPTGTVVPLMTMGPEGLYGHAFGPAERLILSEFYRLAPVRADGAGRFVLPFAKPTAELFRFAPETIPAGLVELRAADQAILAAIERQISALAEREMSAAQKEAA